MRAAPSSAYDLVAVGSGPAGRSAALEAARLGRRVALVERDELGGVSTNAGTVPSKTLRAAVLALAGGPHGAYPGAYRRDAGITIDDLLWRVQGVIERERDAIRDELRRAGVELLAGSASFLDAGTLEVRAGARSSRIRARRVVLAVGTVPLRPASVDFDDRTVLDSDGILGLERVPATLTVVGGGATGLEYASTALALGIRVTLVERRSRVLELVDGELAAALEYHLRGLGLELRLGEEAEAVERRARGRAVVHVRGGRRLESEVVLYAAGRRGATRDLNLAAAGLEADAEGRLAVGPDFGTACACVYAAGDVVGAPMHAAAAAEQGRLAARAALGVPAVPPPALLPGSIHTIPEIAYVGSSERDLPAGDRFAAGRARYRDLVRGEIAGDRTGLLKLVVDAETRRVLGVHILGTGATELVHLGQLVIATGSTVDQLAATAFAVPTFAEAYRVAALDAVERLQAHARGPAGRAA